MFVVRTRVGPSRIHGTGVMADEPIAAGQLMWRFAPGIDLVLPNEIIPDLPVAFRSYLDTYAYENDEFPGVIILSCDHAKFMNHSPDPNLGNCGQESFALRTIAPGEEITCDYGSFVAGWTGFGDLPES